MLIYLLDKETAWNFFAVPTTSNPHVTPSEQILAIGPYLVREASIHQETVSLVGDNANTTELEYVHHSYRSKWYCFFADISQEYIPAIQRFAASNGMAKQLQPRRRHMEVSSAQL